MCLSQWFRLDDHPAHEGDSREQREFVVTRQTFRARNNLPVDLQGALSGLIGQPEADAAKSPFETEFTAQRRGLPLTPAYAHSELARPTSRGVQTATVVGPAGEEVYTDARGASRCSSTGSGQTNTRPSAPISMTSPPAGYGWPCPRLALLGAPVHSAHRSGSAGRLHRRRHRPPGDCGRAVQR
nr:hypothetical protein [Paludibacterium denitrificans]